MKKYLPQIGAGLIGLSLVAMLMLNAWVALLLLLAAGVIDIILDRKDDMQTISQWIHGLFPKKIDVMIMIGLLIIAWWLGGGIVIFLPFCLGAVAGHLFWQENQEK